MGGAGGASMAHIPKRATQHGSPADQNIFPLRGSLLHGFSICTFFASDRQVSHRFSDPEVLVTKIEFLLKMLMVHELAPEPSSELRNHFRLRGRETPTKVSSKLQVLQSLEVLPLCDNACVHVRDLKSSRPVKSWGRRTLAEI